MFVELSLVLNIRWAIIRMKAHVDPSIEFSAVL